MMPLAGNVSVLPFGSLELSHAQFLVDGVNEVLGGGELELRIFDGASVVIDDIDRSRHRSLFKGNAPLQNEQRLCF